MNGGGMHQTLGDALIPRRKQHVENLLFTCETDWEDVLPLAFVRSALSCSLCVSVCFMRVTLL